MLAKLSLERWDHGLSDLEHLEAVLEVLQGGLSVLHSPVLLLDKGLLLSDVLLDFLEQQVDSLSLVVLNSLELEKETLDVLWWSNADVIPFALFEEVRQLSLSFLT